MDSRVQEGLELITLIWQELAFKIIDMAIQVYGLDQAQADALKDVFYKPNDYRAELAE